MTSGATPRSARIEVPDFQVPPGRLITARSFLIDRAVPDCETILLPSYKVPGGEVLCGLEPGGTLPAQSGGSRRRRVLRRLMRRFDPPRSVTAGVVHDARHLSPANWSHFLNIHLSALFIGMERFDILPENVTIVLPADIPDYVIKACGVFGFRAIPTDGPVSGTLLSVAPEPMACLRAGWTRGLRGRPVEDRLTRTVARSAGTGSAFPARVFLARQDTRKVSNQKEIEAFLRPGGFETIYPETLLPADQFRLFHEAEEIVAVHGAGLAPLLYRPAGGRLRRVVEILPAGHMTNVNRTMCARVEVDWIGVRGRITPGHMRSAYDFSQRIFERHSLEDFEVDPVSLERALEGVP